MSIYDFIGPPPPSGADFYLPKREAKALDAAQIAIARPTPDGLEALAADAAGYSTRPVYLATEDIERLVRLCEQESSPGPDQLARILRTALDTTNKEPSE